MKSKDQEKLFAAVREHFKTWSVEQVSGYVHGVVDGLKHDEPQQDYVQKSLARETYAIGYIYGFVDASGADVVDTEWCKRISWIHDNTVIEFRWWERA